MACGHILAAVRRGMAECTPNLRASYEAAETTPRSSRLPPTTTALPLSDGSKSSSTETKKASMSTWKIVLMPAFSRCRGEKPNLTRRHGDTEEDEGKSKPHHRDAEDTEVQQNG